MQNNFLIDISLLPETAKSEIVSFYQYILYKYNLEKTTLDYRKSKKDFFTDVIMVDSFQKMNRDDMQHEQVIEDRLQIINPFSKSEQYYKK